MFGGPGLIPWPAESLHMVGGPVNGTGRVSKGTCATMLVHDYDGVIINPHGSQIICELPIDPTRDYQPTDPKKKPEPPKRRFRPRPCPDVSPLSG